MERFCHMKLRLWCTPIFAFILHFCINTDAAPRFDLDSLTPDPNFTTHEHFAVKLYQYSTAGGDLSLLPDPLAFYGVLYVEVFAAPDLTQGFVKLQGGPQTGLMRPCSECAIWVHESYSCHRQRMGSRWAGVNGTRLWGQEINPADGVEVVEANHPQVFALPGRAVVVSGGGGGGREAIACGQIKPVVHASSKFAEVELKPVEGQKGVASFLHYDGFEDMHATSFGSLSIARMEVDGKEVVGSVIADWSLKNLAPQAQGDIFVNFDHKCYHAPESLINVTIDAASVVHWESDMEGKAGGSTMVNLTAKGSLFDTFKELVELTFVVSDQAKALPIACAHLIYTPNVTGYMYAVSDEAQGAVQIRGSAIDLEAVHQFGSKSVTLSINRGTTCAAPGYSSTVENERWHTGYEVLFTADGAKSIAQIDHSTTADIFSQGDTGYVGHAAVLKSSNHVAAACGVLQRLTEDDKVTVAPTSEPTTQRPTSEPTMTEPTSEPIQSTPRPTLTPSVSPTLDGLSENSTDRTYVIVTLVITGAVVCCTCRRGMRRRSDGRRYSNVDEYGDHGIELGYKDSLQTKDLLTPMETASSRDLDVI